MNIVKLREIHFLKYKILECNIIFILNIEKYYIFHVIFYLSHKLYIQNITYLTCEDEHGSCLIKYHIRSLLTTICCNL